jgi:2-hydroxy-6-oxonona-2,4-dienedioate hydrolase
VQSDFLYWLALRIAPGLIVKTILATPPEVLAEATAAEQGRAARLMEHILPIHARHAGLLNDAAIGGSIGEYPLERIRTRTLVISLADDLYGTYESAGYTASRIRGSHFIGYSRGGHVWIGHHEAIMADLAAFLGGSESALAKR